LAYNDKPVVNDEDSLQSPVNGHLGDENGARRGVGLNDGDRVVCYRVDVLAIVLKEVSGLLLQLGNAPPPVQVS